MSQMGTRFARGDLAPDTVAAATRYLTRTGNADLLDILGLVGNDGPLIIDSQLCCPACQRPYRRDGRTSCRRLKCSLGPSARVASESVR